MFKRKDNRIEKRMRRYVSRLTIERRLERYTTGYERLVRQAIAKSVNNIPTPVTAAPPPGRLGKHAHAASSAL